MRALPASSSLEVILSEAQFSWAVTLSPMRPCCLSLPQPASARCVPFALSATRCMHPGMLPRIEEILLTGRLGLSSMSSAAGCCACKCQGIYARHPLPGVKASFTPDFCPSPFPLLAMMLCLPAHCTGPSRLRRGGVQFSNIQCLQNLANCAYVYHQSCC